MIIVFQGTREGKHGTAAAMVTAAAFQMARANKKIAIMSFCDNERKNNIENFAFTVDDMPDIGNPLTQLGDFEFNDTGIDALVRRSETGVLAKEHFNTCCMPAVKTPNGLDVIGTTNTENFEDDMSARFDVAKGVIDTANEMYNFVFVLADPQHEELTRKLDEIADKIVVVIRQAKIDRDLSFPKEISAKVHLLVADYESESSFGLRYLKNGYKARTLYALPHSVPYRDACANGAIIRFALRNSALNETPGDINYAFSTAINNLLDHLCGKAETEEEIADKKEQEEDEIQAEELKKQKKEKHLKKVSVDEVKPVVIQKKKKGLFKKPETFERVEIGGESPLEGNEEVIDKLEEAEVLRPYTDFEEEKDPDDENPIRHISSTDDEGNTLDEDETSEEEDADVEDTESDEEEEEVEESSNDDDDDISADGSEDEPEEDEDNSDSEDDSDDDVTGPTENGAEDVSETEPVEAEPEDEIEVEDEAEEEVEDVNDGDEEEEVVEAIPEEPASKKKGGFFSFFRKKEVNVREADFSKAQHKSVDAIEAEIQESLRDHEEDEEREISDLMDVIEDEGPAEESYRAVPADDAENTVDSVEPEATPEEEMYDEDEESEPVTEKVLSLDDLDEEDEVPVVNAAPRKLSRREKRMLRESMQIVQHA